MKNLNLLHDSKGGRDGVRREMLNLLLNWATGGYGVHGKTTRDLFRAPSWG